MTEREERQQRFWTSPIPWLALVVLYLASPGPFVGLVNRGVIRGEVWESVAPVVFAPLVWIGEKTSFFEDHPVGRAYRAYIEWFA